MRSLPNDTLSTLIADSVIKSEGCLSFLEYINEIKHDFGCILIAPSNEDKIILLNAIKIILSYITSNNKFISNRLKTITNVYNKWNIRFITDDHVNMHKLFITRGNYLNLDEISFLDQDSVATINELYKKGLLHEHEYLELLQSIQFFIYASVWFNMDNYLEYLYYLYT